MPWREVEGVTDRRVVEDGAYPRVFVALKRRSELLHDLSEEKIEHK